jgi:GNAT superfamily N-acetyltransferase
MVAHHARRQASAASAEPLEQVVLLRPIRSSDAGKLLTIFDGMSTQSRWLRFLTSKRQLMPNELRYFTEVDHHDHEAIVAIDLCSGRGLGVARFIRLADDPESADVAVAVVDAWHGRGLGRALLSQVSERAREEGIQRFAATVSAQNAAVVGLLQHASLVRPPVWASGTVEYEIDLSTSAPLAEAS